MTGVERFFEIIDQKIDIKDSNDAVKLEKVKGKIDFENVSFRYDENEDYVLKNINISIKEGEKVALVGPSGAGKSTLASLIPRFYDITEGKILLDDINIKDIKLQSLRKNIGTVQQDVYLFNDTIFENIAYGKPNASLEEVKDAAKKAGALEFIEQLPEGFETHVGDRGVRLSGGQKQRISIARVFLKNPPILILDEATSSLDNKSEKIIQKSLEELAKGRTTLTIAHRLSTIRNADEIIVLTEEGIIERGTHKQLMAKEGYYYNLYNMSISDVDSKLLNLSLIHI